MRDNLRRQDEQMRSISPSESFVNNVAHGERLLRQSRATQQSKSDPRWMPAWTLTLAGTVSLLMWGLLVWIIQG